MAIVMALAMVIVGNSFMPTGNISAETDWISVTNMPTEAYANKGSYQLGLTSDTSADGKWWLEVGQNEWKNWKGRYKNTDSIEGFIFDDQVYNNAFGCNIWTTDLKSEYNLTPGTIYNLSVTLSFSGVNAAQPCIVKTEGGTINMNDQRTIAGGASVETYTAQVKPNASNDFVFKIIWAKNYNTAEKGKIEVTSFSIQEPQTQTAAPGDWLQVGTIGEEYRLGTTSDDSGDGMWSLDVSNNQWNNWAGRYKYADRFEGFTFDDQVYNNRGGVYLTSQDLKSEYNLTPGTLYNMSVTLGYTGVSAGEEEPSPQNNTISTLGGSLNMNESRTVAAGDSEETYTGQIRVTANDDFCLKIAWESLDHYTAQKGQIEVVDITIAEPPTETAAPGDWINVTTIGEKYRLGKGSDTSADGYWWLQTAQNEWGNWHGRYKYADRFEGFTFDDQAYHNRGGLFITSQPLKADYGLVNGRKYKMSVTINYTGVADGEAEPESQENTIMTVNGGQNMSITRDVAPGDSQEVYEATVTASDTFALEIIWAAQDPEDPEQYTTAQKGQIEVEDISFEQIGTSCVIDEWTFADAPGTDGWQYMVAGEGSTYSGGTSMADPLVINYGPYVPDRDYSCMARCPITSVEPGETCTGSISITSGKRIAGQGGDKIVNAAVYAYDDTTGEETWYAASTNAPSGQDVNPNRKTTFDFEYVAPDTGKVFYVLTTSYTPDTTIKFEATHEGKYNVADYKPAGETATYPTAQGKIFAGWFEDDTYTTPYMESTGYAYAKFIDADALTVKFQKANDGSAIRFVSSIDDYLDYQTVGFKFTGTYGNAAITEKTKTTNSLFTKITAAGESILPSVFSDDSAYFFTYTVRGLDANTDSTWNVTPFIVTADGTTVEGTEGSYPVS